MKKTIISCVCSMLLIIVVQAQSTDTLQFSTYQADNGTFFHVNDSLLISSSIAYNATGVHLSDTLLYELKQKKEIDSVYTHTTHVVYGLVKLRKEKKVQYCWNDAHVQRSISASETSHYAWSMYLLFFLSIFSKKVMMFVDTLDDRDSKEPYFWLKMVSSSMYTILVFLLFVFPVVSFLDGNISGSWFVVPLMSGAIVMWYLWRKNRTISKMS